MTRFGPSGHDMVLCQICCRDVDTGVETIVWRPDVTRSRSAGNVCLDCLAVHDETKLAGEALRNAVRDRKLANLPKYDVEVRLTGQDPNVLVILGRVTKALIGAGIPHEERMAFQAEASSGTYDELLDVVRRWVRVS